DFGNDFDIVAGMEPITQVVEVKNVGAAPLHILDLYLAQGEPSYKVSPISSLVLNVGATAQFTVTFDPQQPFAHPEQVLIDSDDPFTPQFRAEQTGGITGTVQNEDLFEQPAKPMTDIVFIVDNSCSMTEEQANLANNFEYFIYKLQTSNADYQIGVITTDHNDFQGPIITPDTLNAVEKFTDQAVAGTGGSATERA